MSFQRNIVLGIVLFMGSWLANILSAQVVVDMKLDTTDIVVGQQVLLTTTVSADAQSQVKFPVFKEKEEMVKGLEVIGRTPYDTTFLNNGKRMSLTCKYRITAFDSAIYSIPPMQVEVDGKSYAAKSPLGLKVNVIPVDTTKLDQFAGPNGVMPEQFEWRNHLLLMALGAWPFLFLLVYVSIRLTRRKPLTKKVVQKEVVPPNREAIQLLKQLTAAADLSQKDRFVQLTDLLRNYLQRRYEVNALEMTTEEILAAMQNRVGAAEIEQLKLIFETADLVKFAKLVVSDYEYDRCLKAAEGFLQQTVDDAMEHPAPVVEVIVLNDGMQRKYRNMLWVTFTLLFLGGLGYVLYVSHAILNTYF